MLRALTVLVIVAGPACAADALPSWNDGPTKRAILDFVGRITEPGGADFVPPQERIATSDNDGTLWSEQPVYFQFEFAMDRVRALADRHPEWKHRQPFKAAVERDLKTLAAGGEQGFMELVLATHAGMTADQFEADVRGWLKSARHPRFRRPYTELVYQPMLELMAYLRANGFKTYIVSGGGQEFMRAWVERAYGVPPEQVIGSSIKVRYELYQGKPAFVRLPAVNFVDDRDGKAIGIHKAIGRRPVMAFGNSDGDFEMLQYTTAGRGARLGLLVHHTDGVREWAYDRDSAVGRLDKALAAAPREGWVAVDMKKDWKKVYAFDQ